MLRVILGVYCAKGLGSQGHQITQPIISLEHLSCPLQIPNQNARRLPLTHRTEYGVWRGTESLKLAERSSGKLVVQSERPSAHVFEEHPA